jgi:hypothetical protein
MPHRDILRRSRLEPRSSGSGADPSQDWRRFVLEQVGYDEVGRARSARRADRLRALRRFVGGILFGLIVFALAFGATLAVQAFRAGRFDRYLPKPAAVSAPPPSARWAREAPPEPTESRDTHKELQNPFAPPPRAPSPDADDGGSEEGGD